MWRNEFQVRACPRLSSTIALASLFALLACGGTYEPRGSRELADCYATEFGATPPAAVSHLRAKQIVIGDFAGQWLQFEANSSVVSDLVRLGFMPSNRAEFMRETGGANAPPWWQPEVGHLTTFYIHSRWRPRQFSHSVAVLAHDAEQRVVYFHHGAFD